MTQILRDVIHVLTRPHLRQTTNTEGETIYGEEPALLDILEDCVGNSGSGESAASGGRAAPLSLEAVSIAQDIEYTTRAHWPIHGLLRAPLRLRVNAWYANTHQPHEALTMLDVASLAMRLWNEHRDSARLPDWEVVGLEIVEKHIHDRRTRPGRRA